MSHKFDDSLMMPYRQYFRTMFSRTISMIRAFERAFGKENVDQVLTEWSELSGRSMAPKGIEDFDAFKDYWKTTLASENWNKILTCSFPEETSDRLLCEYSECLYASTMKDLNAEDLGYIICCHPDFIMAEVTNPNLRLKRTKTLMQGDNCCDHEYIWTE